MGCGELWHPYFDNCAIHFCERAWLSSEPKALAFHEWAAGYGRLVFFIRLHSKERAMAKPANVKIKLVSTADTGFFYVTKKNPRNITEKMVMRKYDPVVRKHVEFKEAKIK